MANNLLIDISGEHDLFGCEPHSLFLSDAIHQIGFTENRN